MKITDLTELQAEAVESIKIPIAAFNQSEWVNKYVTPDILWNRYLESKVSQLIQSSRSTYNFGSNEQGSGSESGSGEGSGTTSDLTNYYTKSETYSRDEVNSQIQSNLAALSGIGFELMDSDNVVMGRYSYRPNQGVQSNAYRISGITYIQIPVYFNTSSVLYKLQWNDCTIQPSYSGGRYYLGSLNFTLNCTGYGTAQSIQALITCQRSWDGTDLTLYDDTITGIDNTTKTFLISLGNFESATDQLQANANNYITINISIGDHNEIVTLRAGQQITLNSTYYITGTSHNGISI